MFRYNWSLFNAKMGLIFMVGVLIVFILSGNYDFDTMAAGVSALLGWITIILVPKRRWSQHVLGLAVYLVVGAALTWLAYIVKPYVWVKLISMALVTFADTVGECATRNLTWSSTNNQSKDFSLL